MKELDLEDDNVREMAYVNHRPTEAWTVDGTLVGVTCQMCHHEWPCPTRQSLARHLEDAKEGHRVTEKWYSS